MYIRHLSTSETVRKSEIRHRYLTDDLFPALKIWCCERHRELDNEESVKG